MRTRGCSPEAEQAPRCSDPSSSSGPRGAAAQLWEARGGTRIFNREND